ncbi:MAG: ATP-binding protein [Anaerolineae bacterium]
MSVQTNTKRASTSTRVSSDLKRQRDYVDRLKEEGFGFSLVVAEAFVRGIRDLGYKSTATALDELIDNSVQAEAQNIHVVFGFNGNSDAKPTEIAVIDDGHGMDPEMIRLSVVWGGTHREDDREGYGRYGYGLPSASVSQGRRFTVYSKVEGGEWHEVTLDVDDIGSGKYSDGNRAIVIPPSTPGDPPSWVTRYVETTREGEPLTQGTIVVIEKLDKLTWKTKVALERKLLEHFGITYRNLLRSVNIFVNGTKVQGLDPLFLTPGYRFYDLDEDRAEALEPLTLEVSSGDGKALGTVKVRYAYLPPTFGRKDKSRGDSQNTNQRFAIMREHNGIIILRNGRQIAVVPRWNDDKGFNNYDRNWKVEVDFSPTLDEEFSITTSKQQIVISERMWDILVQHGVWNTIRHLRGRLKEARKVDENRIEKQETGKPSERAMADSQKFKTRKPGGDPAVREEKAKKLFDEEVRRKAKEAGLPEPEVERQLRVQMEGHPYKVEEESLPGGPFFRVVQVGSQKVLYLNTAHRFYTDLYSGTGFTPYSRAALEVLLFVLGECEIEATDDRQLFYQTERAEWSQRLNVALERLGQIHTVDVEVTDLDDADEGEEQGATQLTLDGNTGLCS